MASAILVMRILERRRKLRVPRYLKDRDNPLDLNNKEFCERYRLNKDTYLFLCDALRSRLNKKTTGYSVETQILSVLRLLGTGSFQEAVGEEHLIQVSQTTVSRNLKKVCEVLFDILPQFLSFPATEEQVTATKNEFLQKFGFPDIVGVVDCTHIEIQKPITEDWCVFKNEKGKFSIKVQMTCDANCKITDIVVRWPGALSNSTIWHRSGLYRRFLSTYSEDISPEKTVPLSPNTFLIANAKYPLEQFLLTPYDEAMTPAQLNFNGKLKSVHTVIKKCKKMLKSRFRCLNQSGGLIYSPDKVCKIIMGCVVLHNICVQLNAPMPDNDEDFELEDEDLIDNTSLISTDRAKAVRDSVADHLLDLQTKDFVIT